MSTVPNGKLIMDKSIDTDSTPLSTRNFKEEGSSSGVGIVNSTTNTVGRSAARKRKSVLQPKQIDEDEDVQIIALSDDSSVITSRISSSATASSTGKITPMTMNDTGIVIDLCSSSPMVPISPPVKRIASGCVSSYQVSSSEGDSLRTSHTTQVVRCNFRRPKSTTAIVNQSDLSSPIIPNANVVHQHQIRTSPLPHFSWADAREVWELMVKKDEDYKRDRDLIVRHSSLQPRMRSILLDWLSEVSEAYRLHRETFYLSIDFIDRYLSISSEVPKQDLQLIGISCLFIASKIEEIYPPKLKDFAEVTDGACSELDILDKELEILKLLNWDLYPMTVNSWLSVYMQLYSSLNRSASTTQTESSKNEVAGEGDGLSSTRPDFMIPGYPSQFFAQVAHLLDLSILDIRSLTFSYSIMAAAALYHFANESVVFQCTGFKLSAIRDCVLWMTPFALAIRDEGFENPKLFKSADVVESLHNLQYHTADLSLLEKAQTKQLELAELEQQLSQSNAREEPATPVSGYGLESLTILVEGTPPVTKPNILTPPKSVKK